MVGEERGGGRGRGHHRAARARAAVRVTRRRLELARVRVVRGVLELAVRAQVVGARVRRAAQRTLEPAREVHVVVVAYVRHHLAAQLAPVQVEGARDPLERQPHVPALRACNRHTSVTLTPTDRPTHTHTYLRPCDASMRRVGRPILPYSTSTLNLITLLYNNNNIFIQHIK